MSKPKISFIKNDLINSVLSEYFNTFSRTLDTRDFVPNKYLKKVQKYIFKNMKKKFREIDKLDRKYNIELKKKNKKPKRFFLSFFNKRFL